MVLITKFEIYRLHQFLPKISVISREIRQINFFGNTLSVFSIAQ